MRRKPDTTWSDTAPVPTPKWFVAYTVMKYRTLNRSIFFFSAFPHEEVSNALKA